MDLRKHLNPKCIFIGLYFFAFVAYIVFGLQPVEAANYKISAKLVVPSINLDSDVTSLSLENHELNTPGTIAGSYTSANNKTLIIGHSTTVFKDLNMVELGDEIDYNDRVYKITELETILKSHIDMDTLLREENRDTLVLMTCAGELLDGDATHRLIVVAKITE